MNYFNNVCYFACFFGDCLQFICYMNYIYVVFSGDINIICCCHFNERGFNTLTNNSTRLQLLKKGYTIVMNCINNGTKASDYINK